ncbi:hypothetical protein BH10CHL1_BH10CHL1_14190 [soil metagenome]
MLTVISQYIDTEQTCHEVNEFASAMPSLDADNVDEQGF